MRGYFPGVGGWVVVGGFLGVVTPGLSDLAEKIFGPRSQALPPASREKKRIVILGGGFAGMKTAECLQQQLRTNRSAEFTLISETNALLFTPRLADVVGYTL